MATGKDASQQQTLVSDVNAVRTMILHLTDSKTEIPPVQAGVSSPLTYPFEISPECAPFGLSCLYLASYCETRVHCSKVLHIHRISLLLCYERFATVTLKQHLLASNRLKCDLMQPKRLVKV
jgi:hypothetical protein